MINPYYICLLPKPEETVNCFSKYAFVDYGKKWRNGFTEIRKLGHRYPIRHTISNNYHVSNEKDLEIYIKNFLRI